MKNKNKGGIFKLLWLAGILWLVGFFTLLGVGGFGGYTIASLSISVIFFISSLLTNPNISVGRRWPSDKEHR